MDDRIREACARAAHEANRAYCIALGDDSQPPWDAAPEWQRDSARQGVAAAVSGAGPEKRHADWLAHKLADGWVWGPVKDAKRKTHPCFCPYDELPEEQRRKDDIYGAVVRAVAAALRPTSP